METRPGPTTPTISTTPSIPRLRWRASERSRRRSLAARLPLCESGTEQPDILLEREAEGPACCRVCGEHDGPQALREILELVGSEHPAPVFRLNDDLGTHLQVATDFDAEAALEPILEIVEIVILTAHALSLSRALRHPLHASCPEVPSAANETTGIDGPRPSALAPWERPGFAAHRSNIREWYCPQARIAGHLTFRPLVWFRPHCRFL